ncbi:hypothetical protein SDJN02_22316, partial [Cucurbita argyrosperma subsp. argyrosperma]
MESGRDLFYTCRIHSVIHFSISLENKASSEEGLIDPTVRQGELGSYRTFEENARGENWTTGCKEGEVNGSGAKAAIFRIFVQ